MGAVTLGSGACLIAVLTVGSATTDTAGRLRSPGLPAESETGAAGGPLSRSRFLSRRSATTFLAARNPFGSVICWMRCSAH